VPRYGAGGEESGGEEKERLAQSALRPARGKTPDAEFTEKSGKCRSLHCAPAERRRRSGRDDMLLDGATWDCEKAQAEGMRYGARDDEVSWVRECDEVNFLKMGSLPGRKDKTILRSACREEKIPASC